MYENDIFYLREGEFNFLVNLSVATLFLEDFGIPISCCNRFTHDRGSFRGHPMFSRKLRSFIEEQRIHTTYQGSIRVYKLVSRSLAEEVLNVLQWRRNTNVMVAMHDFILMTSNLLSDDPGDHYLRDKGRELLVRRPPVQQRDGEVSKLKFSPLVYHLLQYDNPRAYAFVKIVHRNVKHPGNAPISQLLARMHMHDRYFSKAYEYAEMAISAHQDNSFYMDTKGRIIIEQMRQYLTPHVRNQRFAAQRFLGLLDDGLGIFSQCQKLSKSEKSMFFNLAGYYGELRLIFTFLEILPDFFKSPASQFQKYLLTNKHIPGVQDVFVDRRHDIQGLQDRVEAALGYLTDVRTFCEGGLRFLRRKFNYFCQDRAKLFPVIDNEDDDDVEEEEKGEEEEEEEDGGSGGGDEDDNNDNDKNMKSKCRRRRLHVRSMVEPTLNDVFHFCQNRDDAHTLRTEVYDVLSKNRRKTSFDRKMLVWVGFALASVDTRMVPLDEVERQVQRLLRKSSDDSLNGPFFNLLLSWSHLGAGSERYLKAAEGLKMMWARLYKADAGSITLTGSEAKPRPATAFFLSKGTDIGAFIHVSCLPAFSGVLEHQDSTFWGSNGVEEKLARLEGTLKDPETLLYSVSASEKIQIKLSVRWPEATRAEKVSFYLGFSFAELMAYNVRVTDDGI